jgi:uncharacterized repeat protein (TIGR01451 family)
MKRLRLFGLLATLVILASMGFRDAPKALAGTPVQVTFTITRVQELYCNDSSGLDEAGCPNDYYPKFNIDNEGLFNGKSSLCCAHSEDFRPNWVFSVPVDSDDNPVPVHVELWDQDDFSPDDHLDIAAGDASSLDITFDLNTCTFQGGGLTPEEGAGKKALLQGRSAGTGDDSARIYFSISTPFCIAESYKEDSDGDGLPNGWEIAGIDIGPDGRSVQPVVDGAPDLALGVSPFSADPNHKDIFVEVDWMDCAKGGCEGLADQHSHAPVAHVLDDVTGAFAAAPVDNPDGTKGITLHAMKDEAVPDRPNISFNNPGPGKTDDFDDIKLGNPVGPCTGSFGTAADRASPNCAKILAAKRLVFRYMIFGHTYSEAVGSSGIAELGFRDKFGNPSLGGNPGDVSLGGNDFMVTVWPNTFGAASIAAAGGQRAAEASTFMHELGHTLALQHGGGDGFNCKPNYLSIMNYTLQFTNIDSTRPMDYSSAARGTFLGPLNENGGLDETKGVGGPATWRTVYGVGGKQRTRPANQSSIDWNEINGLETRATADVNFISTIGPTAAQGGCSTGSPNQTLNGFDDWQNLVYNFGNSPLSADGAHGETIPELTGDMVLAMTARADLKVTKSVDKALAIGGDTLSYSVPVTNVGQGRAIDVSLSDSLPDGSTQTRALPDLDADATNTQAFTFAVPCATPDGTVFTNHVSVSGTDESGIPDPDLRDNTAQASTTVHAPRLTLSQTATASVNAGEAINYTISYANTGGGASAQVVISDVLPAGVYYSKALDQGAGPKPDTVTLNADGTRTLVWNVGAVPANSGPQTIVFTARPTLLALGGTTYSNNVSLSFQNANGCVYDGLNASASTMITVVPPTRDPLSLGFWRTHSELWLAETLARIQATDQHYDTGAIAGELSSSEVAAVLAPGGGVSKVLEMQSLAAYFNLATRRINADTRISSPTADRLGLTNVRAAMLYASATRLLPVNSATQSQYSDAITVLEEIDNNTSEVY